MAKKFISASIATGLTIEAGHVTQSADALTGTEAYDITISGSLDINNAPVTNITASGNISASQNISAAKYQSSDKNLLSYTSATDTVFVNASLGNLFLAGNITASSTGQGNISASGDITATNITASGHGLFQAGKPIITHTTSPISSSLANAGKYHIVGGTLTASIVLDSNAPVGAEYEFFQSSSVGQFLFESASGTTVISKDGNLKLVGQGSAATLKKVATSTFHLIGDLTS